MATRFTAVLVIISAAMSVVNCMIINSGIVMEGKVPLESASEELNLFIAPVEHKRLLSKENCRDITICQFSIIPSKTTTKYTLNITDIKPEYTGLIAVCVTPKEFTSSIPILNVPLEKCEQSSLTIVSPPESRHLPGDFNVSLVTWFMDRSNYNEMTLNGYTQVLVPSANTYSLSLNGYYNLPLFGAVTYSGNHDDTISCHMYDGNGNFYPLTEHREINARVKHYYSTVSISTVGDLESNQMYSLNCTITNERINVFTTKGKVISLKVVKIPSLLILKNIQHKINNTISLAVATMESTINVSMVTISNQKHQSVMAPPHYMIFKYHYSLYHHYEIVFPKYVYRDATTTNSSTYGKYTVKVKLHSGQELMKEFSVNHTVIDPAPIASKLTGGPTVTALPAEKRIANGSSAVFECTATYNERYDMSWQKQDGNLSQNTVIERISTGQEDTKILRLTVSSAQYEDTGWYTCIVQTDNRNTSQYINLLVLPEGSPYLDPNYVDPTSSTPQPTGPSNGTDIFGTILNFVKKHYIIVGVAGGCVIGIATAIVVLLFIRIACYTCRKRKRKRNASGNGESNESSSSSSEEEESPRTLKNRLAAARREEERKQATINSSSKSKDRTRGGEESRRQRNQQRGESSTRKSNRNESSRGKRNRQNE